MKVHLKDVRISFANIFEPKQVQGQGDAKFSAAFIFPRSHSALAEMTAAIQAEAKTKWGAKADDVLKSLKASDRLCIHDGDSKPDADAYPGNLFVNASNKTRPLVIGPGREPLVAADGKPYSGCYVNAIVEVWAQDNQFGKRINASLLGVQFLRDGERLSGGGVAAAEDFEAIAPAAQEKAAAGSGAAGLF